MHDWKMYVWVEILFILIEYGKTYKPNPTNYPK